MVNIDFVDKIINDVMKIQKQIIDDSIHLENVHFENPKISVLKKKLDNGQIEYKILFLIPSTDKNDVHIYQIDDNTIEVEVTPHDLKEVFKDYTEEYSEFKFDTVKSKRKIVLPNISDVKQEFKNGLLILTVVCGKRENRKKILLD